MMQYPSTPVETGKHHQDEKDVELKFGGGAAEVGKFVGEVFLQGFLEDGHRGGAVEDDGDLLG